MYMDLVTYIKQKRILQIMKSNVNAEPSYCASNIEEYQEVHLDGLYYKFHFG